VRGDPWFKLRPQAKEWGLVALSSHYELYSDMSARVMELLAGARRLAGGVLHRWSVPGVKGEPDELLKLGRALNAACLRSDDLRVCVRIAPTKTLAKLANKWAKNDPAFGGMCRWESVAAEQREALMAKLSVNELWGVATRLTKRPNAMGIFTIAELARGEPGSDPG
jgi:DNA polymerase V